MLSILKNSQYPSKEYVDSLFETIKDISDNTNAFNGLSWIITIPTFIASVITIFGFYSLIKDIRVRTVDKNCRKKILLDLFRHLFTINTHVEAIRYNMSIAGKGKVLKEGILERFSFIESDLQLSNLRFSDKSYERLHCIQEKMRNFNSVVTVAENHFTNPECPDGIRLADLDDIWSRSVELSKDILKYSKSADIELTEKYVSEYIREYYTGEDRIPKWKEEGKLNNKAILPVRDTKNRTYYDKGNFSLKDIMDTCIRCRINKVIFINPFPSKKTQKKLSHN